MFKTENDVRRWLKNHGPVWWVENKRGGSAGFPDAIAARGGKALFLELKLASSREGGGWTMEAAPAQILALRGLDAAGLEAWVVAGVEGTTVLGALKAGRGLTRLSDSKGVGRRGLYWAEKWDISWLVGDPWPEKIGGRFI